MNYRPDIDGMRAIAVLAVVIFHLFPKSLPAGFIGVDIFFVISGYLITRIILQTDDQHNFDWLGFYQRRVRRIFPVLVTVMAVSCGLAWLILLDQEFSQFGKHMSAGLFFVANLIFWRESGYFDGAAETKPLLHLWSLGIEEQFYLVWPLTLVVLLKYRQRGVVWGLVLAMFSFALCVALSQGQQRSGFYLPFCRAWELLAGALIAWTGQYYWRAQQWSAGHADYWAHLQSLIGGLCLLFGLALIDQDKVFPGYWAMLPVAGASLLILAGPASVVNRSLLSWNWLRYLGLISFSWYLWHWPLLSFARIIESAEPSPGWRNRIFLLSLALAVASYHLIEQPLRRSRSTKVLILIVLAWLGLGALGFLCMQLPDKFERDVVRENPQATQTGFAGGARELSIPCDLPQNQRDLFLVCAKDYRGNVRYALLGDSKAHAMYQGLVRTSSADGRWLFVGGTKQFGATIPVISDAPEFAAYQKSSRLALTMLQKDKAIQVVVFVVSMRALFQLSDGVKAGNRDTYDYQYLRQLPASSTMELAYAGLKRAITAMQEAGKQVVFVVDNPPLPEAIDCAGRKTASTQLNRWFHLEHRGANPDCSLPVDKFRRDAEKYFQLIHRLQFEFAHGFKVFDASTIYCDGPSGLCGATKQSRLLYAYTDHISDFAAGLVGEKLNPYLAQLTAKPDDEASVVHRSR